VSAWTGVKELLGNRWTDMKKAGKRAGRGLKTGRIVWTYSMDEPVKKFCQNLKDLQM